MQRTTTSERVEARRFGQVFRDAATLLVLVLLAISVRVDGDEGQAVVEPRPSGLQAAEIDAPSESAVTPAAEPAVEPAIIPAGKCPKSNPTAAKAASWVIEPVERRVLILNEGAVREIRISAHFETVKESIDCGDSQPCLIRS
jgi:hypothetical protein